MDLSAVNQAALHWLWPQVCAHCREDLPKEAPSPLCPACQAHLAPDRPPFCQRCAEPLAGARAHCLRCSQRLFSCERIRAAFLYRDAAVSLVHSFKFRGWRSAARTAGVWMGQALPLFPELGRADALVPVPLHARRRRERGYNQALLIAQGLSEAADSPVEELLVRMRETRPLWAMTRAARRDSLAGAFACPQPRQVEGRRLWLIDDVCTSGASLEGCAEALLQAGAASVQGYVFARQAQPLVQ